MYVCAYYAYLCVLIHMPIGTMPNAVQAYTHTCRNMHAYKHLHLNRINVQSSDPCVCVRLPISIFIWKSLRIIRKVTLSLYPSALHVLGGDKRRLAPARASGHSAFCKTLQPNSQRANNLTPPTLTKFATLFQSPNLQIDPAWSSTRTLASHPHTHTPDANIVIGGKLKRTPSVGSEQQ